MSIVVRAADIDADRERIIRTLREHLTDESDDRRFDWLYRSNPGGPAQVWISEDRDNGATVGVAAAFPRRAVFRGKSQSVQVLGDFCIGERYRSLGPAVQLQRACLEGVDRGSVAMCYDFPSQSMTAVYRRLGIADFSEMVRLVRPVRVDRKVEQVVKSPAIARGIAGAGNLILRWSESKGRGGDLEVTALEEPCGPEFTTLADEAAGSYDFLLERSADYLNWRYRANPLRGYSILTARRDGKLLAYAVVTHTKTDSILADLFGGEDPDVIAKLVYGAVRLAREQGAERLIAPVLKTHPWYPLLENLGFWARESTPVIVYVAEGQRDTDLEKMKWFITHGDRDS